jgi:hypothetical protein
MNVLSRLLQRANELISCREAIQVGMPGFYEEHSKVFNLRGQTRTDLMRREIEIESYLLGYINTQ